MPVLCALQDAQRECGKLHAADTKRTAQARAARGQIQARQRKLAWLRSQNAQTAQQLQHAQAALQRERAVGRELRAQQAALMREAAQGNRCLQSSC